MEDYFNNIARLDTFLKLIRQAFKHAGKGVFSKWNTRLDTGPETGTGMQTFRALVKRYKTLKPYVVALGDQFNVIYH